MEIDMLTSEQIAKAKTEVNYSLPQITHDSDDAIRTAWHWLDAQLRTKLPNMRKSPPIKHMIENWSGDYISRCDVEVAAHLHAEIIGQYPNYNISARRTEPNRRRLKGFDSENYEQQPELYPNAYYRKEP